MSDSWAEKQTNLFRGTSNAAGSAWCPTLERVDYLDWIWKNIRIHLNICFFQYLLEQNWHWHINWGPGPRLRLKVVHGRHVLGAVKDSREKGMGGTKTRSVLILLLLLQGNLSQELKGITFAKRIQNHLNSNIHQKPWVPSLILIRLARWANIPSRLAWLETYPPYDCLGFLGTSPIDRSTFLTTIFNNGIVKTRPGNSCTQVNMRRMLAFLRLPLGINCPVSWMLSTSKRSSNREAISVELACRLFFCMAALPSPHGFLTTAVWIDLTMADWKVSNGPTPFEPQPQINSQATSWKLN